MSFWQKNKVSFTDEVSPWRKIGRTAGELLQVALLVTAIVLPIRYFLIQPFYVKGASMEPNFYDHEYLIIDEISFRLRDPKRGDISVFRYPNDPSQFFIKRIIGLPGDTVTISGGKVLVQGPKDTEAKELDETAYLANSVATDGEKHMTLGADEYYVLGDHRDASLDSRFFGAVPRKNIIGRVALRGWPLNKVTIFETPQY